MTNINANLRKAAVLLRSVDADTAATLLAQLSPEEATALREAVRALGPVDPDEQAVVLAQFRREKPTAAPSPDRGVELSLTSSARQSFEDASAVAGSGGKRFEFLEDAPARTLASYLAREHSQTIAVVLSHLAPVRAAAVLEALPQKLQSETIERMSTLGDTDAEVVNVLEHELATWVKKRGNTAGTRRESRDTVSSILAAADARTRDSIVANLRTHNAPLAERIAPVRRESTSRATGPAIDEYRIVRSIAKREYSQQSPLPNESSRPPVAEHTAPLPCVSFDHLINADARTLSRLLNAANPDVLALALAGSSDELLERVCDQMPKRVAKAFRRELRRMGPTRLSDVEAAQNAIAKLAAQQMADRRAGYGQSMTPAPV